MSSNATADDLVRLFRSEALKRRNGTAAAPEPPARLNFPAVRGLPAVRELPRNGTAPNGDGPPQDARLREWIEQIHGDLAALRSALQPLAEDLQLRANDHTAQLYQSRCEATDQRDELRETHWNLMNVAEDVSTVTARVDNLHGEIARVSDDIARLSGLAATLEGEFVAAKQKSSEIAAEVARTGQANSDALAAAQAASSAALGRLEERLANDAVYFKAQLSRLRAMLDEGKRPASKRRRAGEKPADESSASDAEIDAFYLAFENEFRGRRTEIKKRLKVYLPFLAAADVRGNDGAVLDLGCGRGEWLELLKKERIGKASGVDLNTAMVEQCTGRGLDAVHADAVEYLRSQKDDSFAAITSFHLIEHLPFRALLVFLREIHRALRSGGSTILETPNPRNILVGASDFFRDMTPHPPIHPDTIRFTLETIGFAAVRRYFLQDEAKGRSAIAQEDFVFRDMQSYVDVPRDYAVIARKA
ncbi:MAG TPA: methyltransferase domain-containing protein [Chthoniobacterales bacterium]|nr:methyltransferase domain-containing protein [Chthoniobacterales bacterium]